jgi:maltose-binding protein MalE
MQFSEDFSRGFKDQNYAMTFAGAWALNYILTPSPYTGNPPARFRWGAAITPLGPASRQALMGTALEVINRRSKNKNAAWWLTRFLTEGKGGALEGAFGIGIPGSIKLAQDPRVKAEYGPLLAVFIKAARYGRGMRVVPRYSDFWNALSRDLDPLWNNTASVAAATARACQDVKQFLR